MRGQRTVREQSENGQFSQSGPLECKLAEHIDTLLTKSMKYFRTYRYTILRNIKKTCGYET